MRRALPVLACLTLGGCAPSRPCETVLWYTDDGTAADVVAVGDWNDWDPAADPLREEHPGVWRASVSAPEGDHAYMLQVDGRPTLDLRQPLLKHNASGGREHSLLRVEDCTAPKLLVRDLAVSARGALDGALWFLRGDGGPRLDEDSVKAKVLGGPSLPVTADSATGEVLVSTSGLSPGKHTVVVSAEDEDGAADALRLPVWVEPEPFEWRDALVYQVMVDRFADAQGALDYDPDAIGRRAGGTLAGVLAKLESGWFEDLGVGAIWLTPVQPAADGAFPTLDGHLMESYHGYWPVSTTGVDPRIGTEAQLDDLIEEAHAQGIRVVLDVIPNHVHEQHPWAERPERFHGLGEESCVCGTPSCPWSDHIETCWFADYMPDLDWEAAGVRDDVVDAIVDIALRHDVDGFRVDAVPMIPRAAVRELVWAVGETFEQAPTDFLMLGETFSGPGEFAPIRRNLGPHGLDSQFDFPLMWGLRGFLAWDSLDAEDLAALVAEGQQQWAGSGATLAPFVGNHDVSRFVSEAAGHATSSPWTSPPPTPSDAAPYTRLVMAQTLAFTLPGMPVLWQGDEVGLAGATDPDCRRPMQFSWEDGLNDHQIDVLDATRTLGRTRQCSEALRRGALTVLWAQHNTWVHLRHTASQDTAMVFINRGDAEERVEVIPPASALSGPTPMHDVLGALPAVTISPGATTQLTLPPRSVALLVPAAAPCATALSESP